MGERRPKRAIDYLRNTDGTVVGVQTQNHFRDAVTALEKARHLVDNAGTVVRMRLRRRRTLTMDDHFFRLVRSTQDPEQKGKHIIFIADRLKAARQVEFHPAPRTNDVIIAEDSK